jgi:hypothetical protein
MAEVSQTSRGPFVVAAVVQAFGALIASLAFLAFIWNGYNSLAHYHQMDPEAWRACYWAIGPIGLGLSIPVGLGNGQARRYSRALCFLYPVGPTLDLLTLKARLHGGEVGLAGMAMVGVVGGAALWVLLRPSTVVAV